MEEEDDQLQYKYVTSCNGSSWPAPKEEVVDHLQMEDVVDHIQWKKSLTNYNGRYSSPTGSSWSGEIKEVFDHLQWMKSFISYNGRRSGPVAMEDLVD